MFTASCLTYSFPKHLNLHDMETTHSWMILWHNGASSLSTQRTERKNLQCNPSWSLHQRLISFPVLIALPQLPILSIGSGICVHHRNCYLYPTSSSAGHPSQKEQAGISQKENMPGNRGEFRYYGISGVCTTAPEERWEWYPANTTSSNLWEDG